MDLADQATAVVGKERDAEREAEAEVSADVVLLLVAPIRQKKEADGKESADEHVTRVRQVVIGADGRLKVKMGRGDEKRRQEKSERADDPPKREIRDEQTLLILRLARGYRRRVHLGAMLAPIPTSA